MAKARDSCPITGLDIVLVSPRRLQRVGALVRQALRKEAAANRVAAPSLQSLKSLV
jgi:hypothetical protein